MRDSFNIFSCVLVLLIFCGVNPVASQNTMQKQVTWKCGIEQINDSLKINLYATIAPGVDMYGQNNAATMPMIFNFTESDSYSLPAEVKEVIPAKVKFDDIFNADISYFIGSAHFQTTIVRKSKDEFNIDGSVEYQICFKSGMCMLETYEFTIAVEKENQ